MHTELSPTLVGESFYNGEVESELRRISRTDYCFKKDSDRDECMKMIEMERRCNNYLLTVQRTAKGEVKNDEQCVCIIHCAVSLGCGRPLVTDGIWNVSFPHCMFRVEASVSINT